MLSKPAAALKRPLPSIVFIHSDASIRRTTHLCPCETPAVRQRYTKGDMRYLIALLALAGLIDSALALRIHLQDPSVAPPCAVTEQWDCGAVNHGRFSVFPPTSFDEAPGSKKVHIPVAILGIAGYALIAGLALANQLWATLQVAEIGFAFAAFLTYLEAYVIEKWCIYCVYSQVIIAAIVLCTAVALIVERRRVRTRRMDAVAVA